MKIYLPGRALRDDTIPGKMCGNVVSGQKGSHRYPCWYLHVTERCQTPTHVRKNIRKELDKKGLWGQDGASQLLTCGDHSHSRNCSCLCGCAGDRAGGQDATTSTSSTQCLSFIAGLWNLRQTLGKGYSKLIRESFYHPTEFKPEREIKWNDRKTVKVYFSSLEFDLKFIHGCLLL